MQETYQDLEPGYDKVKTFEIRYSMKGLHDVVFQRIYRADDEITAKSKFAVDIIDRKVLGVTDFHKIDIISVKEK